jgi:hypothetical protein
MAGFFMVSSGNKVTNTWEWISPDSALLAILGMWQPMQFANE